MTDFDKRLIEKARDFKRWDYPDIRLLINLADTPEGRDKLWKIHDHLRELCADLSD